MTRYLTTEAEFIDLLAKNGDWASEQNINESIITLKREQLAFSKRTNVFFGERPQIWNSTTSYSKGDLVQHGGKYWACISVNINMQPEISQEKWEEIAIDIDADKIAYNKFIIQDLDPQTEDATIWDIPRSDNEILWQTKPTNVFDAIQALDQNKTNINGNSNQYFLVQDNENGSSAVTKQWTLTQLSTKASINGSTSVKFNVSDPTANTHATNKLYVDNVKGEIYNKFNDYALLHGNSSYNFSVANPSEMSHAVNKGYVDAELANVLANGSNNIIRKIDKVIVSGQENTTSVNVSMKSGEIIVFSGSILMYEGVDYTISSTNLIWTSSRKIGERITVLFLEEGALTSILDPIYVKQTGDNLSGILKCSFSPSDDTDLSNKKYVDDKSTEAKNYTNTKLLEMNNYVVPKGGIISFSGSDLEIANLAPYWYICDGNNGTPDLRGRFLVSPGTIGSHTFTNGEYGGSVSKNITVDNLPPHSHELLMGEEGPSTHNATSGYNELTLKPVVSGVSGNSTVINNTGGGQSLDILPPYYVMAYIMRAKN